MIWNNLKFDKLQIQNDGPKKSELNPSYFLIITKCDTNEDFYMRY